MARLDPQIIDLTDSLGASSNDEEARSIKGLKSQNARVLASFTHKFLMNSPTCMIDLGV